MLSECGFFYTHRNLINQCDFFQNLPITKLTNVIFFKILGRKVSKDEGCKADKKG